MHIHFEKSINVESDSWILSLSWMGKVPDELPEEEGWKLNRTNYYQEGWLSTGSMRGILGVTFTTTQWKEGQPPSRTNFNLRGHRSQITLVQWNEPYQKLASCDSSGIIFVWIKFEGRWSIELINDRSTPVTHFSWSHDGRMALICYQDGFVLVGSVAGQRYWSSMLNLDSTITAGTWTPDDQQVYFGTSNGQLVVMDVHGMMVSQIQLPVDSPVTHLSWNCEKFKMEESEEGELWSGARRPLVLAVAFKNGLVYLMRNFDDLAPVHVYTGMQGLFIEWSNSGEYLAVAGTRPVEVMNQSGVRNHEYFNSLHFYSPNGTRICNVTISATESPVTALCFGHNDKRIFVATGKQIHIGWVSKRIASLQLLCRLTIYKSLSTETCVAHLPLPLPVRALISSLHTQTIISNLPSAQELREFSIHPRPNNQRFYCTMIRHDEDVTQSPGTVYTLYIEYLGGLVPILKGKRISKLRPEFIIYDPEMTQVSVGATPDPVDDLGTSSSSSRPGTPKIDTRRGKCIDSKGKPLKPKLISESSDSDDVELCASPRMQRKRHRNRLRERAREQEREREEDWERNRNGLLPRAEHQLTYNDTLPEALKIAEITSNIWGTKFKIRGLVPFLPGNLGHVTYRTSVLHLQPRQMTIRLTELRDENDIFFYAADPFFQDEDEEFVVMGGTSDAFSFTHASEYYYTPPAAIRCILQSNPLSQITASPPNSPQLSVREIGRHGSGPAEPCSSYQTSMTPLYPCQVCEAGFSASTRVNTPDILRHNSFQRLKGSLLVTARAHIERIDESGPSMNSSPPSSHSLSRTSGVSIRSPTRRCWTTTNGGSGASASNPPGDNSGVAPVPVTAPIHVRRSMSASYLDSVQADHQLPVPLDVVGDEPGAASPPRRLILVANNGRGGECHRKKPLKDTLGKSKSWDSYDLNWWKTGGLGGGNCRELLKACPKCSFPTITTASPSPLKSSSFRKVIDNRQVAIEDKIEKVSDPESPKRLPLVEPPGAASTENLQPPPAPTHRRSISLLTPLLRRRDEKSRSRAAGTTSRSTSEERNPGTLTPASPQHTRKYPSTPQPPRKSYLASASSPLRQLFANSPLLSRRKNREKVNSKLSPAVPPTYVDSSEDEESSDSPNFPPASPTSSTPRASVSMVGPCRGACRDHHKNQLRPKLGKKKVRDIEPNPVVPRRREFVMSNKAPMWNENSQVYQLDFGGRVTQESAKNFQLNWNDVNVNVLQFGRIDGNAYTLDFQYPFSALQAFAVALANVTQRLK